MRKSAIVAWLAIGGMLAILAQDVAGAEMRYEAEVMQKVYGMMEDKGDHLAMYNLGMVKFHCELYGKCTVEVRAREDHYPGGFAQLQIRAPSWTDTLEVDSGTWKVFQMAVPYVGAGDWELVFINPKYNAELGYDRNLYLDYLIVRVDEPPLPPGKPDTLLTPTKTVLVRWDQNTEEDLVGYKVYRGQGSGNYGLVWDVGLNNSYMDNDISYDITYYYAVTAYDTAGNESGFSEELAVVFYEGGQAIDKLRFYFQNIEMDRPKIMKLY